MSLETRFEAAVAEVLDAVRSDEIRIQAAVREAISVVVGEERKRFARLLDKVRDEYMDWCALNRIPPAERVEVANMLRHLAALVARQPSPKE